MATLGGGMLLFFVDRLAKKVTDTFERQADAEEREEAAIHRAVVFLEGLPPTPDRPPVPGFIDHAWPSLLARTDQLQRDMAALTEDVSEIRSQLSNNGGASVKDKVDWIFTQLGGAPHE